MTGYSGYGGCINRLMIIQQSVEPSDLKRVNNDTWVIHNQINIELKLPYKPLLVV